MRKTILHYISAAFVLSAALLSCRTTETESPSESQAPEAPVQEETPRPEEIQDDVEFLDDEPAATTEFEEEYLRSIGNIETEETVTISEFEMDKAEILAIIDDMVGIMNSKNVKRWLTYIEPDSVSYYSNPANLRKAQKKLPDKRIVLRSINDYFENVFIPARQRSQVDEIRYISKSSVKAVQVKADFSTVVYYYFTKLDGKWYVHIPPIS